MKLFFYYRIFYKYLAHLLILSKELVILRENAKSRRYILSSTTETNVMQSRDLFSRHYDLCSRHEEDG